MSDPSPGGRWRTATTANGLRIAYRVSDVNGRLLVTDLYVHRDDGLTSRDVAGIPVRRYRAQAEAAPEVEREGMTMSTDRLHGLVEALAEASATVDDSTEGVTVSLDMSGSPRQITGKFQFDRPVRPRITRPNRDPAFYRLVADAYREYLRQGNDPSARIADEAEVPVGTVYRWVREARRLSFLDER